LTPANLTVMVRVQLKANESRASLVIRIEKLEFFFFSQS
jgi:hypothetical protein